MRPAATARRRDAARASGDRRSMSAARAAVGLACCVPRRREEVGAWPRGCMGRGRVRSGGGLQRQVGNLLRQGVLQHRRAQPDRCTLSLREDSRASRAQTVYRHTHIECAPLWQHRDATWRLHWSAHLHGCGELGEPLQR